MKFTKMHGIGNDYVYVNCFKEEIKNPSELARFVSNRNFGVGSDGLILIRPSEKADFQMDMYNSDGSQAEMCGNGIRCVGKYVYDYGLTDKTQITIDTLAGIKYLDLTVEDGKVSKIRVNMGEPILTPEQIPVISKKNPAVNIPIEVKGKEYHMTCVSMGNPHAIVFMDHVKDLDIEVIGPHFENHTCFPKRTNTEFVEVLDRNTVNMRVWERGAGETLACGTGACATAVACVLNDKTEDHITVHLLGGDLEIEWDKESNQIYMTGPATTVFDGELFEYPGNE
ncbi:MAG: diaminopimelate epimerase [Lachnospiraceae bacterium]|nr:diaminopimelate epimerase [Lachnospiraceae bacterium]